MGIYVLATLPAALAAVLAPKMNKYSILMVWAFSSVSLWFLVPNGSRDFPTYLGQLEEIRSGLSVSNFVRDPLFYFVSYLFLRIYSNTQVFLLSLASVALLIKILAIKKLSNNSSYAVLIYMSSFFFLHEFTQIRVALALGVWMHALNDLEFNKKRYYALTLLASLFHLQAAIGFLVPTFIKLSSGKTRQKILLVLVYIITILGAFQVFDLIGDHLLRLIPDPRTEIYFKLRDLNPVGRPNPFNSVNLLAITIGTYFLLKNPGHAAHQSNKRDTTISTCVLIGSIFLTLFSSVAAASSRMSDFFFCLLPILICSAMKYKEQNIQLLITMAVSSVMIFVFVFHGTILLTQ